jgi:hypothetical protein
MRIISNYHDYYDSCMIYGMDPKCIYKRDKQVFDSKEKQPVDIKLESNSISFGNHRWSYASKSTGVVWFCGQSFPFIVMDIDYELSQKMLKKNIKLPTHYYCYSTQEVEDTLKLVGTKDDLKNYFEPPRFQKKYSDTVKDRVEKFFTETKFSEQKVIDELCRIGVPCLRWGNKSTILNPVLKDIQFYVIKDSFTAFQELSMFISGVMGGQSPPMIPISDKIRKEKHGFDEWSFRKKVR